MLTVFDWLVTNWIQVFGVLTGGLAVLFLALNKPVLGWSFGIINAVFFIVLMTQYHLYADTTLNVYYFITSSLGLYWWLRGGKNKTPLKITHLTGKGWLFWIGVTLVGTAIMGFILSSYTAAEIPYLDSLTTVMSFVGQFLLARKIFDNWYIWIAADVIDIGIYVNKGLPLVAVLTAVYMAFCVIALFKWRQVEKEETTLEEDYAYAAA